MADKLTLEQIVKNFEQIASLNENRNRTFGLGLKALAGENPTEEPSPDATPVSPASTSLMNRLSVALEQIGRSGDLNAKMITVFHQVNGIKEETREPRAPHAAFSFSRPGGNRAEPDSPPPTPRMVTEAEEAEELEAALNADFNPVSPTQND